MDMESSLHRLDPPGVDDAHLAVPGGEGRTGLGPDHTVDLAPPRALECAHGRPGLRPEDAVGPDAELALDPGDRRSAASQPQELDVLVHDAARAGPADRTSRARQRSRDGCDDERGARDPRLRHDAAICGPALRLRQGERERPELGIAEVTIPGTALVTACNRAVEV